MGNSLSQEPVVKISGANPHKIQVVRRIKHVLGGDNQKIAGADPGDHECPVDWLPSVRCRN